MLAMIIQQLYRLCGRKFFLRESLYSDAFFWAFGLGCLIFSFYTCLGFCLSYKTMHLVRTLAPMTIIAQIVPAQNKFWLSFIGDFALQTSSMFFSGWLFAPVIFLISQYGSNRNYIIPILLLGAYTTYTIVAFAWPVLVIRNKIREEKKKLRAKHAKVANKLLTNLDSRFLVGEWKHFRLQDSLLSSINSVGEWPLNLDVIINLHHHQLSTRCWHP
jgi:hypothetical protein